MDTDELFKWISTHAMYQRLKTRPDNLVQWAEQSIDRIGKMIEAKGAIRPVMSYLAEPKAGYIVSGIVNLGGLLSEGDWDDVSAAGHVLLWRVKAFANLRVMTGLVGDVENGPRPEVYCFFLFESEGCSFYRVHEIIMDPMQGKIYFGPRNKEVEESHSFSEQSWMESAKRIPILLKEIREQQEGAPQEPKQDS